MMGKTSSRGGVVKSGSKRTEALLKYAAYNPQPSVERYPWKVPDQESPTRHRSNSNDDDDDDDWSPKAVQDFERSWIQFEREAIGDPFNNLPEDFVPCKVSSKSLRLQSRLNRIPKKMVTVETNNKNNETKETGNLTAEADGIIYSRNIQYALVETPPSTPPRTMESPSMLSPMTPLKPKKLEGGFVNVQVVEEELVKAKFGIPLPRKTRSLFAEDTHPLAEDNLERQSSPGIAKIRATNLNESLSASSTGSASVYPEHEPLARKCTSFHSDTSSDRVSEISDPVCDLQKMISDRGLNNAGDDSSSLTNFIADLEGHNAQLKETTDRSGPKERAKLLKKAAASLTRRVKVPSIEKKADPKVEKGTASIITRQVAHYETASSKTIAKQLDGAGTSPHVNIPSMKMEAWTEDGKVPARTFPGSCLNATAIACDTAAPIKVIEEIVPKAPAKEPSEVTTSLQAKCTSASQQRDGTTFQMSAATSIARNSVNSTRDTPSPKNTVEKSASQVPATQLTEANIVSLRREDAKVGKVATASATTRKHVERTGPVHRPLEVNLDAVSRSYSVIGNSGFTATPNLSSKDATPDSPRQQQKNYIINPQTEVASLKKDHTKSRNVIITSVKVSKAAEGPIEVEIDSNIDGPLHSTTSIVGGKHSSSSKVARTPSVEGSIGVQGTSGADATMLRPCPIIDDTSRETAVRKVVQKTKTVEGRKVSLKLDVAPRSNPIIDTACDTASSKKAAKESTPKASAKDLKVSAISLQASDEMLINASTGPETEVASLKKDHTKSRNVTITSVKVSKAAEGPIEVEIDSNIDGPLHSTTSIVGGKHSSSSKVARTPSVEGSIGVQGTSGADATMLRPCPIIDDTSRETADRKVVQKTKTVEGRKVSLKLDVAPRSNPIIDTACDTASSKKAAKESTPKASAKDLKVSAISLQASDEMLINASTGPETEVASLKKDHTKSRNVTITSVKVSKAAEGPIEVEIDSNIDGPLHSTTSIVGGKHSSSSKVARTPSVEGSIGVQGTSGADATMLRPCPIIDDTSRETADRKVVQKTKTVEGRKVSLKLDVAPRSNPIIDTACDTASSKKAAKESTPKASAKDLKVSAISLQASDEMLINASTGPETEVASLKKDHTKSRNVTITSVKVSKAAEGPIEVEIDSNIDGPLHSTTSIVGGKHSSSSKVARTPSVEGSIGVQGTSGADATMLRPCPIIDDTSRETADRKVVQKTKTVEGRKVRLKLDVAPRSNPIIDTACDTASSKKAAKESTPKASAKDLKVSAISLQASDEMLINASTGPETEVASLKKDHTKSRNVTITSVKVSKAAEGPIEVEIDSNIDGPLHSTTSIVGGKHSSSSKVARTPSVEGSIGVQGTSGADATMLRPCPIIDDTSRETAVRKVVQKTKTVEGRKVRLKSDVAPRSNPIIDTLAKKSTPKASAKDLKVSTTTLQAKDAAQKEDDASVEKVAPMSTMKHRDTMSYSVHGPVEVHLSHNLDPASASYTPALSEGSPKAKTIPSVQITVGTECKSSCDDFSRAILKSAITPPVEGSIEIQITSRLDDPILCSSPIVDDTWETVAPSIQLPQTSRKARLCLLIDGYSGPMFARVLKDLVGSQVHSIDIRREKSPEKRVRTEVELVCLCSVLCSLPFLERVHLQGFTPSDLDWIPVGKLLHRNSGVSCVEVRTAEGTVLEVNRSRRDDILAGIQAKQ